MDHLLRRDYDNTKDALSVEQLDLDVLNSRVAYIPARNDDSPSYSIQIVSNLPQDQALKSVGPDGKWTTELARMGNGTTNTFGASDNEVFVVTDLVTDAFVTTFKVPAGGHPTPIVLGMNVLTAPNDIGPPPQPSAHTLIPQDSYPILVGYGRIQVASNVFAYVRRLQYWHRTDESYSLGKGEEMEITTSTTTGRQSTTSKVESVATALGMSSSVGWGPISASISAAINTSTVTQQSVALMESNSTFITKHYENQDQTAGVMCLHWALVDQVQIVSAQAGVPVTNVIETAYAPRVVQTYPGP